MNGDLLWQLQKTTGGWHSILASFITDIWKWGEERERAETDMKWIHFEHICKKSTFVSTEIYREYRQFSEFLYFVRNFISTNMILVHFWSNFTLSPHVLFWRAGALKGVLFKIQPGWWYMAGFWSWEPHVKFTWALQRWSLWTYVHKFIMSH